MSKHSTLDIKDWITRAIEFITTDIWRVRLEDLPFGKSFLIKQLRIIILTLRGFDENKCSGGGDVVRGGQGVRV